MDSLTQLVNSHPISNMFFVYVNVKFQENPTVIPENIGHQLRLVRFISLINCQLTGTIPPSIGDLMALRRLQLNDNQLTGPIPESIGNLRYLEVLGLSKNELTGTIPPGIGNLTYLIHLNLSHNQLTGPIPPGIGDLNNLKYLSLSYNQLTGTIPESICNLTALRKLLLNDNDLTGKVPDNIGKLTKLEVLFLFNNQQLSRELPYSFGNLKKLITFWNGQSPPDRPLMRQDNEPLSIIARRFKKDFDRRSLRELLYCTPVFAKGPLYGYTGLVNQNLRGFLGNFGKIMKPYKKFIVQNKNSKKKGLYFKTRFGEQKLRDDATGLYLKGANKEKMYLHRWK